MHSPGRRVAYSIYGAGRTTYRLRAMQVGDRAPSGMYLQRRGSAGAGGMALIGVSSASGIEGDGGHRTMSGGEADHQGARRRLQRAGERLQGQ